MVPRAGFEPAAFPLGGERAIQLCHRGVRVIFPRYRDEDNSNYNLNQ